MVRQQRAKLFRDSIFVLHFRHTTLLVLIYLNKAPVMSSLHGAVGGKADLTLFRDVLVDAREKVAQFKKQGRTLAEVIAAKPTARYDAEWGQSFQSPKSFLGWVYQGV